MEETLWMLQEAFDVSAGIAVGGISVGTTCVGVGVGVLTIEVLLGITVDEGEMTMGAGVREGGTVGIAVGVTVGRINIAEGMGVAGGRKLFISWPKLLVSLIMSVSGL